MSSSKQPNEVLHRNVVSTIVHLHLVAVQIDVSVRVVENRSGHAVARVACEVVRQHHDDVIIRKT